MNPIPHDILAEQWTLGAMLLDNQCIDDVAMVVQPKDFYRADHEAICKAIYDLWAEGKPATTVTLMSLLASLSFDDLKIDMVESLTGSVNHGYGAAHHAAIVRDKALKREMITAFEEMTKKCYEDHLPASELADQAESAVFAVAERESEGGTVEAVAAVDEAIELIKSRANGVPSGVTTGIDDLDEMLDGMQPGQLVVVAARPGVGKSALGLGICEHISLDRHQSAILFAMEMKKRELGQRMISSRGQIDGYRLKSGINLSSAEWKVIHDVRGVISRQVFGIDDNSSRSVGQIAASIRRRVRRNGAVFACIDYLQLIDTGSGNRDSRQEQVAKMSRRLKILAGQVGIPIMLLSQLNREAEKREDKRPKLADLRESGAIEQDADMVLLLHRSDLHDPNDDPKDRSPRKCEIIVAKNRNGATGTVHVDFFRQWAKFANVGEVTLANKSYTTDPKDAPF